MLASRRLAFTTNGARAKSRKLANEIPHKCPPPYFELEKAELPSVDGRARSETVDEEYNEHGHDHLTAVTADLVNLTSELGYN